MHFSSLWVPPLDLSLELFSTQKGWGAAFDCDLSMKKTNNYNLDHRREWPKVLHHQDIAVWMIAPALNAPETVKAAHAVFHLKMVNKRPVQPSSSPYCVPSASIIATLTAGKSWMNCGCGHPLRNCDSNPAPYFGWVYKPEKSTPWFDFIKILSRKIRNIYFLLFF